MKPPRNTKEAREILAACEVARMGPLTAVERRFIAVREAQAKSVIRCEKINKRTSKRGKGTT